MVPPGGRLPVSVAHDKLDAQHEQWQSTFRGNPDMYGTNPSEPGAYAAGLFSASRSATCSSSAPARAATPSRSCAPD